MSDGAASSAARWRCGVGYMELVLVNLCSYSGDGTAVMALRLLPVLNS